MPAWQPAQRSIIWQLIGLIKAYREHVVAVSVCVCLYVVV